MKTNFFRTEMRTQPVDFPRTSPESSGSARGLLGLSWLLTEVGLLLELVVLLLHAEDLLDPGLSKRSVGRLKGEDSLHGVNLELEAVLSAILPEGQVRGGGEEESRKGKRRRSTSKEGRNAR